MCTSLLNTQLFFNIAFINGLISLVSKGMPPNTVKVLVLVQSLFAQPPLLYRHPKNILVVCPSPSELHGG